MFGVGGRGASIPDAEKYLVLVGMACKSSDAILRVERFLTRTNKNNVGRVLTVWSLYSPMKDDDEDDDALSARLISYFRIVLSAPPLQE